MSRSKKPTGKIHPAIGSQKKEKAKRVCLSCDRPFNSRCRAHRICSSCRRSQGDVTLPTVYRSEIKDEID